MPTPVNISLIEKLKKEILIKAGITTISPNDCKRLSGYIFDQTNCNISPTTLKRIYGFAVSRFHPSTYTLNALSQYCGHSSWATFSSQVSASRVEEKDAEWSVIRENAGKITDFTIRALHSRSGIPYSYTISRSTLSEQMGAFSSSRDTCALLSALSGHGKTLALCHWAEEKMESIRDGNTDDVLLFFSTDALFSAMLTGMDINGWLMYLLGFSDNSEADILSTRPTLATHKFYLVIDGLDEYSLKGEHFRVLTEQAGLLIAKYQDHPWFKMILSMRPSAWAQQMECLHIEDSGNVATLGLPLFSPEEILRLASSINPSARHIIKAEWVEYFQYPLFFQYYYKRHKNHFTLNHTNHLLLYELVSDFVRDKIYMSPNADEKMFLLHRLVLEMDLKSWNFTGDKFKLSPFLKHYRQAYTELLGTGWINEVSHSDPDLHPVKIMFGNKNYLEYSLAKAYLAENDQRFDANLAAYINATLAESPHKLPVVKWCLLNAIKSGQQESYEHLTAVELSPNEKADLVLFLGELLDQQHSLMVTNEALNQYFSREFSDQLFDYFFGLELVTIEYDQVLHTLLKFRLSERKKIMVHTALGTLGVIRLDLEEIGSAIENLQALPAKELSNLSIDPLNCLEIIYHYFKYGLLKKDGLEKLSASFYHFEKGLNNSAPNDLVIILGVYTGLFFNNDKKLFRILNKIGLHYKNDTPGSTFAFFIKVLYAEIYFKQGDTGVVGRLYEEISAGYKKEKHQLSPYMRTLFTCLKVRVLLHSEHESLVISQMRSVYLVGEQSGSQLSKFVALGLIVAQSRFKTTYPEFYQQSCRDHRMMVVNSGLDEATFLQ